MSVTYGFYNASNHDRKYNARQLSSIFDGVIKDGVFQSIGGTFIVTAGSGMTVNVATGRAWFNHTWTLNDAPIPLTVAESDLLLPRIDAVVLEVNESVSVRANSIKIVKGTASANPIKPTLTNNSDVHQYPLCYITIPNGATSILQDNIENMVGTSSTPFVTGILETVNIDDLLLQWNAQFGTWFDGVKNTLSNDVAGNLLNKINDVSQRVPTSFHGSFSVDGWQYDSTNSYWWQSATLYDKSGSALSANGSYVLDGPVTCDQTSNLSTNEILMEVINLINMGYTYLLPSESNKIRCNVSSKPSADVVGYWKVLEV